MSITLAVGETVLDLPYDLYWQDEHDWTPVAQTEHRGVTGSLILMSGVKSGGRPITLVPPPMGDGGWMPYSRVSQIQTWRSVAEQEMLLTIRGTPYSVFWRHSDSSPSFEHVSLIQRATPLSTDMVSPTFRFLTKEAV